MTSDNADSRFSDTILLFRAANAGDKGAVNSLLAKYHRKIHKLARIKMGRKLRSKMDSMDIVQDAMLKALESVERADRDGAPKTFECEAEFLAWLYKIVQTQILDNFKHYDAQKGRWARSTSWIRPTGA